MNQETSPEPPDPPSAPTRRPRRAIYGWGLGASAFAVVLLALFALVRLAPLTDAGRSLIVAQADGASLGPLGRLHVAGLSGDLWHDFTLQRLSIADAGGPWLEARNLHVRWRPSRLLRRRIHAQLVQVDQLTLLRRPVLQENAPGGHGGLPVSIFIDHLGLRLETRPAFSVVRGLFQMDMNLDIARKGGVAGSIQSKNLLHAGDGMEARFDLGVGRKVLLDGRAHESQGGALAGMLGLPVTQAVIINAKAGGDLHDGWSRFSAFSGQTSIAQASGVWTKAGGGMQGWISLTASTWTARLSHAFGPQLTFSFTHSQGRAPLRDIALRLVADNAALSLTGPLDVVHQRSTQGLRLSLTAKDLSRIIPRPAMGSGRIDGLWTGAETDWDLTGRASVERLALGAYVLAQASGPVHLVYHHQELRLTTAATGAGGQGPGLIGALAGGRPQASLDGSRLPDGRLMLRALKIDGAGLKLDASGAIGLLGDLNFKGGAQLTNLAAARPGAKGAITARWSAAQFRASQPWKFNADLTGAGLNSGQAEVDRLLGPKPQLHVDAAYDQGDLTLAKAELNGAAAHVLAKGAVAKDVGLKLTLDWSAQGPFEAGPIEAAGKVKGTGVIGGALSTPHADLVADLDRIELPQLSLSAAHVLLSLERGASAYDGKLNLTAQSQYGPAHARADFRYGGDRLDLSGLDILAGGVAAQGALSLSHWAPSNADLSLSADPGAFVGQGHADARLRITDTGAGGGPGADLSLNAADLLLKGQTSLVKAAKFTAKGPLAHLPYTMMMQVETAQSPLQLNGSGQASRTDAGLSLTFNGAGHFRSADFHTLTPATVLLGSAERDAQLDLSVGGGRAQIKARQAGAALNLAADLTGVDLGTLGENLAGRFDANLSLSGQGERLQGQMDARLKGARSRDAPSKLALDGSVKAELAGSGLTLDAVVDGASTTDHATLHAILPAATAAWPLRIALDRTQPIAGQFSAKGELQPIWDLFFGGQRELGGQLTAQGALAGTLAVPKITGHAVLGQGLFEDAATGLKLRDLAAEADLQNEAINVERFSAKDAKAGVLTGEGQLSMAPNGASTLTLNARGFQLLDNETAKATATGAITVVRDAQGKAKLSGHLTVDRADIQAASTRSPPGVVTMDVVERNRPVNASQGLQAAPTTGPTLQLDVHITAPRHVFVRGLGLDAELSLDAQVVGDTSAPLLQGKARVVRGIYDFAGKRFEIDDSGVIDLGSSPDQIRLDLSATLNDPTLTAIIQIKGTAAKPLITLTSTPVLPSDEVLSQVLFGQSAAQLSPVQAAQLAAAVTTLATGGGFDVMGGLGKFARLDRVALGGTSATGVTVSGGKYIGNNVYLELTGGGRQGPSAQVEIRATRSLSVISQIGGDVGAQLSLRWRKEYGKPAGSK